MASNAADYIHSEEMADFGGTVTLHDDSDGVLRVTNGTPHPLDDCQAVRGGESGRRRTGEDRPARARRDRGIEVRARYHREKATTDEPERTRQVHPANVPKVRTPPAN